MDKVKVLANNDFNFNNFWVFVIFSNNYSLRNMLVNGIKKF